MKISSQIFLAFPSDKRIQACIRTVQKFRSLPSCSANKWMSLLGTFSSRNQRLPWYCSPAPDPLAWATDAMLQDRSNLDVYAFPPLSMVRDVINKILLHDNVSMTGSSLLATGVVSRSPQSPSRFPKITSTAMKSPQATALSLVPSRTIHSRSDRL